MSQVDLPVEIHSPFLETALLENPRKRVLCVRARTCIVLAAEYS
jgi:hypothetical protein